MSGWRYAFASAIGTSHVRTGDPCQDTGGCSIVATAHDDEVLIAIACDGAGSARLSHLGSEATCRFVTRQLTEILQGLRVLELAKPLVTTVVLDAQQHLRELAGEHGASLRELACTLVVAVVAPEAAAFFQVGDGVAILAPHHEPADTFSYAFWPERGEYANMTAFITDDDVVDHLQCSAGPDRIDEVAVLTDGIQHLVLDYQAQAAHAPFFRRVLAPLRSHAERGHLTGLSASLASYLESPAINDRTDDDKTLILASRRPPEPV